MSTNYGNEASKRNIGFSQEPCHPTNILWTDEPWKGRVLFTGPDGICDHQVTVEPEHRYVGIGTMSEEGTSETDYLWRAAPRTPFPRPKSSRVGEIGWSIPNDQDWSYANSARQIMLGHFRQELEDKHSHLYQNAWYPGPKEEFAPGTDASLVMNVYRSKTADPGRRNTNSSMSKYSRYQTRRAAGSRRRPSPATSFTNYNTDENSSETASSRPGDRTQNYLSVNK